MRPEVTVRRPAVERPKPLEELVPKPIEWEMISQKLDAILKEVLALKQIKEAELEILRHTRTIPEDYDASDGVQYELGDGYAATTTLKVPSNHVFLFKGFYSSDILGTTYATYVDGRLYVNVPDLDFPGELGIPVEKEVKIVVTNASGATQTYVTYVRGIFRPRVLWKRTVRRAW